MLRKATAEEFRVFDKNLLNSEKLLTNGKMFIDYHFGRKDEKAKQARKALKALKELRASFRGFQL